LIVAAAFMYPGAALGRAAAAPEPAKARDPAAAEVLYKRGRELLAADNWPEACAKFEASLALNPAASTMLNIAKCHEHDKRLSEALIDYKRALQLNQDTLGDERKKALSEVAKKGIADLEPRIAKLRITMKEGPPGLVITRDGKEVPVALLGEVIPVDPGAHEVRASAPGYHSEPRLVTLNEGESVDVELVLTADPAAKAPPEPTEGAAVAVKTTAAPDTKAAPDAKTEGGSAGGAPTWAWIAGGAGLALAGAGVALRFDGLAAEDTLTAKCGSELICYRGAGYDPTDDNTRKNRDFALFVGLTAAGAVGVGAAIVGFARGSTTASKKSAHAAPLLVTPIVAHAVRGVAISGAF
jgi:hypothetical protein